MVDNTVQIGIEVVTEGQEAIKQVGNDLADLTAKTEKSTAVTAKTSESVELWNKSLVKQIPELRSAVPLMSALGLGSLLTGAAIGAVAVESLKMAQALEAGLVSVAMMGMAVATSGAGPMQSWSATLAETTSLARALGLPIADITAAMSLLLPATRDMNTAESLLVDAEKMHLATGMSLTDAVKQLIAAYTGATPVFDETTKKQLLGLDATNKVTAAAVSQTTVVGQWQQSYTDFADRGIEGIKNFAGFMGTVLLNVLRLIPAALMSIGLGIADIIKGGIKLVAWFKEHLPDIGKFFSDMWNGVWAKAGEVLGNIERWVTNLLARIRGLFGGGGGTIEPTTTPMLPGMAGGGVIPGPTLLTSLVSGQPYAIAGEAGPESVGGAGTAIININMDGTTVASLVWNRMENQVRLRGAY